MIGINKKMCVYIIYIALVALVWFRSGGGGIISQGLKKRDHR